MSGGRAAKNLSSNLDLSSDIVYNETINQVVILCHLEANSVTFRTQKENEKEWMQRCGSRW